MTEGTEVHTWEGPDGQRREFRTHRDGQPDVVRWEQGGAARKRLLISAAPIQERSDRIVVVAQGVHAMLALTKAGYASIALPEGKVVPDRDVVEWAARRTSEREWVMWPPKTEIGYRKFYRVREFLPEEIRVSFANVPRSVPQGGSAVDAARERIVEAIQGRGEPHMPDPDTTKGRVSREGRFEEQPLPADVWKTTGDPPSIIRDSPHNVNVLLRKEKISLSWNRMIDRMVMCRGNRTTTMNDNDIDDLFYRAYVKHNFRPAPKGNFDRFLGAISRENSFDPVLDYLRMCPAPSSDSSIDKALRWLVSAFGLDPEEHLDREAITLTMLGLIARQYLPGCPWKYMAIIKGGQDCGKSVACASLCPRKDWLRQGIEPTEFRDKKTLAESTEGIIMVEMSELSAMGRVEDRAFKSRLSETKDGPYRPSHMRIPVSRERRYIFIGTTNEHDYLTDKTGNVRYWPVDIPEGGRCDFLGIRKNRDRLWGAAHEMWMRLGATHEERLGATLNRARQLSQDMKPRHLSHEVQDTVLEWVHEYEPLGDDHHAGLTVKDLLNKMGVPIERHIIMQRRLIAALRIAGWKRARRSDVGRTRVWRPPPEADPF